MMLKQLMLVVLVLLAFSQPCLSQTKLSGNVVVQEDAALPGVHPTVEWFKVPPFLVGKWKRIDAGEFIWYDTFGSQMDSEGNVWSDLVTPRMKISKRGITTLKDRLDKAEVVSVGPTCVKLRLEATLTAFGGLIHAKRHSVNTYSATADPDKITLRAVSSDGPERVLEETRVEGFVPINSRCGIDLVKEFQRFQALKESSRD